MEIVFRKKSAVLTNVVNEKEIWRVVALGNVAHIDWSSMDVSPMAGGRRQDKQRLIDISLDHNIEQTIDKPTRGGNILDLLFTNNKSTLQNVVIMPPLGKSDHDIIYAEINVWHNRVCTLHRKVFVIRKADWD